MTATATAHSFDVLLERKPDLGLVILSYAQPIGGPRWTYRCLGHLMTNGECLRWFGRELDEMPLRGRARVTIELEG